ncbi:hypothetical protein BH11BAC3_BH11BAC3_35770 [soil metagenome]
MMKKNAERSGNWVHKQTAVLNSSNQSKSGSGEGLKSGR